MGGEYTVVLSSSAIRDLNKIPRKVADAVLAYCEGPLVENPHRVSKKLRNEFTGTRSARNGSYRILFEIDENSRVVNVLNISHRAHSYRPGGRR